MGNLYNKQSEICVLLVMGKTLRYFEYYNVREALKVNFRACLPFLLQKQLFLNRGYNFNFLNAPRTTLLHFHAYILQVRSGTLVLFRKQDHYINGVALSEEHTLGMFQNYVECILI